jgi:MFS transporter, PPP family, 3-phenylpropionic acid transporter
MRRRPPPLPTFLAVYGLLYAAFGVQSPFLPALLSGRGLQAGGIGIVLAASTAIRVLAGPAVCHIADRLRRHTLTLCACSFVAAITGLGYVTVRGFSGLLLVALVQAAMLAPIVPLSDALATTAARRSGTGEGRQFEYGWLRASGSAAFIVGTMLSGWTASDSGLASIVWFSGTLLGIGGAASLLLPAITAPRILSDNLPRSTTRDWASLLQIPAFRLLLIIAALVVGRHAPLRVIVGVAGRERTGMRLFRESGSNLSQLSAVSVVYLRLNRNSHKRIRHAKVMSIYADGTGYTSRLFAIFGYTRRR